MQFIMCVIPNFAIPLFKFQLNCNVETSANVYGIKNTLWWQTIVRATFFQNFISIHLHLLDTFNFHFFWLSPTPSAGFLSFYFHKWTFLLNLHKSVLVFWMCDHNQRSRCHFKIHLTSFNSGYLCNALSFISISVLTEFHLGWFTWG